LKKGVRGVVRLTLALGVAALLVGAAACSSDDSSKEGSGSSSASAAVVDPSGAITIVARDNRYEPKDFTGTGGQAITVTMDNKGAAIHDFKFVDQKDASGEDLDTGLISAGQTGTLQFTLPAGTYDFFCTVHPVEMRGKMTLQ